MQNVIDPTITVPLGVSPDGTFVEPQIAIAGTPSNVFIAEAVWNTTLWQWFTWHAPTIWLIAFVVLAIVLGRRIYAVLKRPQEIGKWYCSGCNQLLASPHITDEKKAAWATAESRCPECGERSERGPIAGTKAAFRVSRLILPLWVIGWLLVMSFMNNVSWGKKGIGQARETWPVAGLEPVMGSWALYRTKPIEDVQGQRFWKLDPIGGEKTELGLIPSVRYGMLQFVSPDGKSIVAREGDANGIVLIDTATGSQRRVRLSGGGGSGGSGDAKFTHVEGYSDDGKIAFVSAVGLADRTDELFAVELASGNVELIGRVVRAGVGTLGGNAHSNGQFRVKLGAQDPVWIHIEQISNWPAQDVQTYVRWTQGGRSFEKDAGKKSGYDAVNFLPEANAVSIRVAPFVKYFSLATGEEIERPEWKDELRKQRKSPLLVNVNWGKGSAVLQEWKGSRQIGKVLFAAQAQIYPAVNDTRFFAAVGARKVDGPLSGWLRGVAQVDAPEVLVWDLDAIAAANGIALPQSVPAEIEKKEEAKEEKAGD